MREWLVIESSRRGTVFAPQGSDKKGYIPRDVAEKLLGRPMEGTQWFTREESEMLRGHAEFSETEPL